ncbi:MAG: CARDB domain-containing protein [Pseudomonadota bacterium]
MKWLSIADVDGDGSTEIVVASNDYAFTGWQGITVIGDRTASWAPARPVWNQYAYHITNVEADGGIPAAQQPNWASWNNFRAAGSEQGPPTWKADLGFGEPSMCLDECDTEGHALLWLPVQNSGLVDAGAFSVTLTVDEGGVSAEVATETVSGLAAGASVVLGPWTLDTATWDPGRLIATLDAEDAVVECDHEGNTLMIGVWPCP